MDNDYDSPDIKIFLVQQFALLRSCTHVKHVKSMKSMKSISMIYEHIMLKLHNFLRAYVIIHMSVLIQLFQIT